METLYHVLGHHGSRVASNCTEVIADMIIDAHRDGDGNTYLRKEIAYKEGEKFTYLDVVDRLVIEPLYFYDYQQGQVSLLKQNGKRHSLFLGEMKECMAFIKGFNMGDRKQSKAVVKQ